MKPLEFPAMGSRWSDDEYNVVRVSGYYWNEAERCVEICNVGHGANTHRRLMHLGDFYLTFTGVET